jgi:hypothetical protein
MLPGTSSVAVADPDPHGSAIHFGQMDPHWEYGTGSWRAKITQFLRDLDEEHNVARCREEFGTSVPGSVLRIRIRIHFGQLDPDPHWEYGSGSGKANITHKSEENSSFKVPEVVLF